MRRNRHRGTPAARANLSETISLIEEMPDAAFFR
jgi:hypothetical protein